MFIDLLNFIVATAAKRQRMHSGLPLISANASALHSLQIIGIKGIRAVVLFTLFVTLFFMVFLTLIPENRSLRFVWRIVRCYYRVARGQPYLV